MRSGVTTTRARIKIRRILQNTDNGVPDAMEASARTLEAEIKQRVPRDSGDLADAISMKMLRRGLRAEVGIRGKKNRRNAFYARFIEFGTKGYSGRTIRRGATRNRSDKLKADGSKVYGVYPDIGAKKGTGFMRLSWALHKNKLVRNVSGAIDDAVKQAARL